jgi:hypothetical protein
MLFAVRIGSVSVLIPLAALLSLLAWTAPTAAQAPRAPATLSLAQAERNATDLKHGMSLEEVQRLLGKPRRTALKSNGSSTDGPWQGTLKWTYVWPNSPSPGSLHVEFAARTPEQWYVNGWEWATY